MDAAMQRQVWLSTIQQARVIAVIRAPQFELGVAMAQAAAVGGMPLIEVTWNSDRAAELLTTLRRKLPNCLIGAGTLTTPTQIHQAIAAGAEFLFTPHVDRALIEQAIAQDVPLIAGALTPTEIVTAWQAGAASVKVFPVQPLGGAAYIRSLQGPLGDIPLIPTGGVTLANALDFLAAGAIAVGVSSDLFPNAAIQSQDWATITAHARQLVQSLSPTLSPTPASRPASPLPTVK